MGQGEGSGAVCGDPHGGLQVHGCRVLIVVVEVGPGPGVVPAQGHGEGHGEAEGPLMGQGELHHRPVAGHGVHHLAGDAVGIQGDPKVQILDGIGLRQILAADGPLDVVLQFHYQGDVFPGHGLQGLPGNLCGAVHVHGHGLPVGRISQLVCNLLPALGIPGAGAGGLRRNDGTVVVVARVPYGDVEFAGVPIFVLNPHNVLPRFNGCARDVSILAAVQVNGIPIRHSDGVTSQGLTCVHAVNRGGLFQNIYGESGLRVFIALDPELIGRLIDCLIGHHGDGGSVVLPGLTVGGILNATRSTAQLGCDRHILVCFTAAGIVFPTGSGRDREFSGLSLEVNAVDRRNLLVAQSTVPDPQVVHGKIQVGSTNGVRRTRGQGRVLMERPLA